MGETPTPSILQGLAPDVQAAINPAQPGPQPTGFYSGANNGPVTPGTGLPLPPNMAQNNQAAQPTPTAPDIHPVDKMANSFMDFLTDTLSKEAGPSRPQPGSFASKLAGAASALGSGLGDMRTGGDPAQGHGWLGAVGATLNARNERMDREKQQDFDKQERLKADQINLARANMDAVTHARMLQNLDKPIRDAAATSLSSFYGILASHGYKVEDHLTKAELDDKMKDPKFASTHTGGITGYEPQLDSKGDVQKDAKGRPIEVPMYSIADIAPGDASKKLKVDASLSKKWADAGVDVIPAGTLIPASLAVKFNETAQRFGTTLGMLNLAKVEPLPDDVKEQMVDALKSPEVATAMSHAPGNPLAGLYNAQDIVDQHIQAAQKQLAAAQQSGNQQAVQAAQSYLDHAQTTQQHLATTINQGFTDGERSAYLKDKQAQEKEDEKEKKDDLDRAERAEHDRAMESIARANKPNASPEEVSHAGQLLADSMEDPSQLSKRGKSYQTTINAADDYSWQNYGKPFNVGQQTVDYKYASKAQDTLKYLNSLTGGPGVQGGGNLGELVKQSNGITRTEFPPLNDAAAWARLKTGDPKIAAYNTVVLEVADQVAKILQGGGTGNGTSDAKLKQAQEMFDKSFTKDQITAIAGELAPLLGNRTKAMIGNNRYLQRQFYGQAGVTATMVLPDGKTVKEIPMGAVDTAKSKGARMATLADYNNGLVRTGPSGQ